MWRSLLTAASICAAGTLAPPAPAQDLVPVLLYDVTPGAGR